MFHSPLHKTSQCQDELLNGGYVFKENMRADSDSDGEQDVDKKYKKEKRENRAIKIKQAADNSRKTGCKKSFDLWRTKKEMSEKGIKALHSCDQPALVEEVRLFSYATSSPLPNTNSLLSTTEPTRPRRPG